MTMNTCKNYCGNQYCNLYKSKVASAYCGDICKQDKDTSTFMAESIETKVIKCNSDSEKGC